MHVAVLMGGNSPEQEISLNSGKGVVKACKELGYITDSIVLNEHIEAVLPALKKVDVVFSVLHGGAGEDGTIQGYLDAQNIRYTGSGVLGSALCMDKHISKIIAKYIDIPTPDWQIIKTTKRDAVIKPDLNFPLVVKPNAAGSTIGLTIIDKIEQFQSAVNTAFQYSETVIVEQYIRGRELTVAIVGDNVFPIVEIIPAHGLYDYECKYEKGMSEYQCPAKLDNKLAELIKNNSMSIYQNLRCEGYGRVDFRLDEKNQPWFLELNTLPGMTNTSLVPKAVFAEGWSFTELIRTIIEEAIK